MEKRYNVSYFISTGWTAKHFNNYKDATMFMKELDKRIEKGTCSGYTLTETLKVRTKNKTY